MMRTALAVLLPVVAFWELAAFFMPKRETHEHCQWRTNLVEHMVWRTNVVETHAPVRFDWPIHQDWTNIVMTNADIVFTTNYIRSSVTMTNLMNYGQVTNWVLGINSGGRWTNSMAVSNIYFWNNP